jgi:hypothetical protein
LVIGQDFAENEAYPIDATNDMIVTGLVLDVTTSNLIAFALHIDTGVITLSFDEVFRPLRSQHLDSSCKTLPTVIVKKRYVLSPLLS